MNQNNKTWQAVIASLVVAIGLAVVWGLLLSWGTMIATQIFFPYRGVSEGMWVAADGTPVIQTKVSDNDLEVSNRTLDGKPWPIEYEKWLSGPHFPEPAKPPGLMHIPLSWHGRFAGGSDGKHPPTSWYLLRNAEPEGKVYLAGFDAVSNLPIGYIGMQGFRSAPPPLDQQFSLPKTSRDNLYSVQLSSQHLGSWDIVQKWDHQLSEDGEPSAWLVFLAEEDRLVEIDLRKRSVQTALAIPGLQAIGRISWYEPKLKDAKPDSMAEQTEPQKSASDDAPAKLQYVVRFALRTQDKVVIFDPVTEDKQEFKIPAELLNKSLTVNRVAPQQLMFHVNRGYWSGGNVLDLLWTDAEGQIQKQQRVELANKVPMSEKQMARPAAVIAPVPLAWLGVVALVTPLTKLQQHHTDDYGYVEALRDSLEISWQPMIVVFLVGLLAAGIALRLHRKYHRPWTALWVLFVFLLGPVGLLAYWLGHRRAVLESCSSCGKTVPRDREGCASCGEVFTPPALIGTEIFA